MILLTILKEELQCITNMLDIADKWGLKDLKPTDFEGCDVINFCVSADEQWWI